MGVLNAGHIVVFFNAVFALQTVLLAPVPITFLTSGIRHLIFLRLINEFERLLLLIMLRLSVGFRILLPDILYIIPSHNIIPV